LEIQNYKSWKEAKATWWWIDTNELDKYMQTKKIKNLFFIWEIVDITGKTGWFNLQWAWSSWFACSRYFK
jgi:predicted flavoprotein YhiN